MKIFTFLLFLVIYTISYSQTSSEARIKSYEASFAYSFASGEYNSGNGVQLSIFRSYPEFFKKKPRKNKLPWYYYNLGFQYTTTSTSTQLFESTGEEAARHDYRFHALQVPLELEFKLFKLHGGGQIKSLFYSLFSAHAGINIGVQFASINSSNETIYPTNNIRTNPFQMTLSTGIRVLKNMHGFSANLTFNKDILVTLSNGSYKNKYLTFGVSWNRLDSECSTAKRRSKGLMKELRGG